MIFRIGKLNIELSFPLVAIMTAVIIFDTTMSVVICFIAIIMHETGHLAALSFYGAFPKKIKLTLFDIAIVDSEKYTRNSRQELVVVLAGVTVNFVFAVVSYIVFRCTNMVFFGNMAVAHATLGVFNILPVDSLDGGQALFIILTKHFSIYKSMIILDIISFIVLVPVACTGFIVLLRSKYNFTLLLTALYLITVILLKHKK